VCLEGEVFVPLGGVQGDGVDVGLADADGVRQSVDIDVAVVIDVALDLAEVDVAATQVALHQTIAAQAHLQVEVGQGLLQGVDVEAALLDLVAGDVGSALEAIK